MSQSQSASGANAGGVDAGPPGDHETRRRLRRLAWLLDSSIALPGGFRIGLDGLIGLVPGIGDAIAAGLSSYIIVQAARLNVAPSVLARMGVNVLLELVVGTIPVLGDLFDFVFKANERNVALLERYLQAPRSSRTRSRLFLLLLLAALLAVMVLVVSATVALLGLAWDAVATTMQ